MSEPKPSYQIPQAMMSEVFALAAELQIKHEQAYSLAELIEIGTEAHISAEFIQQAFEQIQEEKRQVQKRIIIWKNCGRISVAMVLLTLLTSFVSLLNDRSTCIVKNDFEDSELLLLEGRKLSKPLPKHHQLKHY